jgi:germination protein, Ger(x)C family
MLVFKKIVCVLISVFSAFLLTGCWNNRPITDLAIVLALGFDEAPEGNVLLTAQVIIPSKLSMTGTGTAAQSGESADLNVTVQGKTTFDAVRNLLTVFNRKAYFGQVQLIAIGEKMAKEGVDTIWDFMERDNEFSRTMRVVVVQNATAKTLLEAKPSLERLNAVEIEDTLDSDIAFGKSVDMMAFQLTELLGKPRTGIVTGVIQGNDSGELTKMDAEDSAVLKHGKLVGYFTSNETRGYMFAMNMIKSTILVIPNPEQKDKSVSLEVIRSTGTINARMENGKPVLSIDVKTTGNIGDEQGSADLFNDKDIRQIENEASALIKDNVDAAVAVSQKDFDSDVFDFNQLLYCNEYSAFQKISEKWDEMYRDAKVSVAVNFRLDRPGLIKRPAYTQ